MTMSMTAIECVTLFYSSYTNFYACNYANDTTV